MGGELEGTNLMMLVDGENLLHRSFHKFERLKTKDGKSTGAIFGFFKSLHYLVTRFMPDYVVVTFDNGHSPVRTKLLPSYKAHRQNIAIDFESLQKQKKIIRGILKCLRIPYIFDKHHKTVYEGDDFLAWFAINSPYKKTLIVSSDKDFNQLITNRITIFNPAKDDRVNKRNCKQLFGYEPEETVDYLTMVGDSSDDIPGFRGYGEKKTRQVLDEVGTLEASFKNNYWGQRTKEYLEVYERNKILIDLRYFTSKYPIRLRDLPMTKCNKPINMGRYLKYCEDYSLNSMKTELFLKPFKDLYNGTTNRQNNRD